ncbi:MAG TPA: hypothetical protein VND20_08525 [Candidatus Binataceae bacterium]|nr:hypothetical protein [Candidatus Binataceae bacterium]
MEASPSPTLVCTEAGVFVWPGYSLVERRGASFVRASDRAIGHLVGSLCGASAIYGPLIPTLDHAARLLERGQVEKAKTCIARLRLPPRSSEIENFYLSGALDRAPPFAKVFNPDLHPRWPAGQSDGGQFRPADDGPVAPVSDPDDPQSNRPPTFRELNLFGRQRSADLKGKVLSGGLAAAVAIARFAAEFGPIVTDEARTVYSRVISRFDQSMSLDELIARTNSDDPPSWPAYENHHIVEVTPNTGKIPDSLLQSRQNQVIIPYYIHRDVSDFYSTPNREYGGMTPRDYLRGKSFEEQYQFGLMVMRKLGVLK